MTQSAPATRSEPELGLLSKSVARPPSAVQRFVDRGFLALCRAFAWASALLACFIVVQIGVAAIPAIREHGTQFLWGSTWDPNQGRYAILPEIWGTLYSSIVALGIGTAFGLSAAVFLSEGFFGSAVFKLLSLFRIQHRSLLTRLPDQCDNALRNLIELLAAIPSVVYGLWGIFVVIPALRPWSEWLHAQFGWFALFHTPFRGPGMLPASIVLGIMILPTITALARDALVSVPPKLRMAAYGMGATRWETIGAVLIPSAGRGIFAAIVLAFGRALGETMALAMLVGNANRISLSLFSPANTLAALLANNFPEAGPREVPVLMYVALVLLGITLVVNVIGAALLTRAGSTAARGAQ